MSPILYMTALSPPSRGVLMTAKALELELELRNVDLTKRENHNTEYLKLNPLHTVPTLVDGEVIITDSHAINAYLVRKYAKNDDLYPKDFAKRALVDQMLHFDSERLFNLFRTIVAPIFYRKTKDVPQDEVNKVIELYKILEGVLEKNQWVAGDKVTIADISLWTSATALNFLVPVNVSSFPQIVAWIARIQNLPWAKVNDPGLKLLGEVIEKCKS